MTYPEGLQYFDENFKTLNHKPNSVVLSWGVGRDFGAGFEFLCCREATKTVSAR